MQQLIQSAEEMAELLEQILGITQNQMTILLGKSSDEECIQMLEGMAAYKEKLTDEMEVREKNFQAQYDKLKAQPMSSEEQKKLKERVAKVLLIKEQIIEAEQKNLFLLQDASRRCGEKVQISKNPSEVVNAYKKHGKK